jgi:hypothetical protein
MAAKLATWPLTRLTNKMAADTVISLVVTDMIEQLDGSNIISHVAVEKAAFKLASSIVTKVLEKADKKLCVQ